MELPQIEKLAGDFFPHRFGADGTMCLKLYGWKTAEGAARAQMLIEKRGAPAKGLAETVLDAVSEELLIFKNASLLAEDRVTLFLTATLEVLDAKYSEAADLSVLDPKRVFFCEVMDLKKATTVAGMREALRVKSRMGNGA